MSETGEDGFLEILGYRQFYRAFGRVTDPPVLVLHGGPGATHDYLLPLADLRRSGFRVVFFDQLGCGRSEIPSDRTHFTLEHHVAETEAVRQALGLGKVHLVGSSYGGLLALAVALTRPTTLRSLTTVGGLADVPLAQREMDRLRAQLPPAVRQTLDRCEASGKTDGPEYAAAADVFYHRHLCRLRQWPPEVTRSMQEALSHPVYPYMNGPSEFTISGTIKDINLVAELGGIRVPTLVLGGREDEVTPKLAEQIREAIPGARGHTFEKSSHMPFWEEREAFLEVLSGFLRSVDGAAR